MTIQPGALKKIQYYRKMLFFVNLPIVAGIPLFVHFGLPELTKKDVNLVYVMLHLTDFLFCFNSIVIYQTVQKIVTAISFLPDEHKIKITQYKDWLLREKVTLYDPKELIKCKKQVLNPYIGYRSVEDSNDRLGTEAIGLWHDR